MATKTTSPLTLENAIFEKNASLKRDFKRAGGRGIDLADEIDRLALLRDEVQLLDRLVSGDMPNLLRMGGELVFKNLGVKLAGIGDEIYRGPSYDARFVVTGPEGEDFFTETSAPCEYSTKHGRDLEECVANIKAELLASHILD